MLRDQTALHDYTSVILLLSTSTRRIATLYEKKKISMLKNQQNMMWPMWPTTLFYVYIIHHDE